MIQHTKEYNIFKFRDDNREKIDQTHIKRLIESIKSRNLLDLCPIRVNSEMEIIDGQHRLLAAKNLNLDIYYIVDDRLFSKDIILMNISKSWFTSDYLNYYCKNGFDEYIKLQKFIKKNNIQLRIALVFIHGESKIKMREFKEGKFVYNLDLKQEIIDQCQETMEYIKRMNGYVRFISTAKFLFCIICIRAFQNFAVLINLTYPFMRFIYSIVSWH